MRRSFLFLPVAAAVIAGMVACTNTNGGNPATKTNSPDTAALVKRGEYLVNSVGCDDCHSPKRMGAHGPELIPELRLSGFRQTPATATPNVDEIKKGWAMFSPDLTSAAGPWGQSFAANITSDATGIGNWSEENFFISIREGKSKGIKNSRNLLPPMPWFTYKNMTDEDLRSIFYYLKTTKPVKNLVPGPKALADL